MFRLSAPLRIALGLASLATSVFLASRSVGLGQDEWHVRVEGRAALCEMIAMHISSQIDGESLEQIQSGLNRYVSRNEDLMSIGLRTGNDSLAVDVGDHLTYWNPEKQSDDQMFVPLFVGDKPRGIVELRFADSKPRGLSGYLRSRSFLQLMFVLAVGTLLYSLYLSKMLNHLDPSQVIPDRVRSALDTFAEGLLVLDSSERIVQANRSFISILGEDHDLLPGSKVKQLPWIRDDSTAPWTAALKNGTPHLGQTMEMTIGQRRVTFLVNASPIFSDKGKLQGVLASFDDVTLHEQRKRELEQTLQVLGESREQIRQQNTELRMLATRDPLTGCMNRRSFFETIAMKWENAAISGTNLTCIMIDVDHFKMVNDVHGHSAGDEVLRTVGRTLLELEKTGATVCRFGGEEFCIALEETSLEASREFAEDIREIIKAERPGGLELTVSIGVAVAATADLEFQTALDHADRSLYVAKMRGRDRVVCRTDFTDDEFEKLMERKNTIQHTDVSEPFAGIPFHAVTALVSALSYRDAATAEHSRRVADLTVQASHGMLSIQQQFVLETAALLHDVGKIGTPDSVLLKPGPLDSEEKEVMSLHDFIGIEIVKTTFDNEELINIIANRYAWYGGHPNQPNMPVGKDIPLGSRILAICDSYDSIVSDLVYRRKDTPESSFAELRKFAGSQFDPELVERFIHLMEDETTNVVTLGEAGVTKQTAKGIGLLMSCIAQALEEGDKDQIRVQAEQLAITAIESDLPQIADIANELQKLATSDQEATQMVEVATTLLDLCRETQKAYVAVCQESRQRRETLAQRVFSKDG